MGRRGKYHALSLHLQVETQLDPQPLLPQGPTLREEGAWPQAPRLLSVVWGGSLQLTALPSLLRPTLPAAPSPHSSPALKALVLISRLCFLAASIQGTLDKPPTFPFHADVFTVCNKETKHLYIGDKWPPAWDCEHV